MMLVLFWVSFLLVVYTVVAYPLAMIIVGVLRRTSRPLFPRHASESLPSVSVIVAACNEEEYIKEGLSTLLDSDYPPERRNVVVVTDDGCVDRTVSIVESFLSRGVHHVRSPHRGKNACLDFVVDHVTDEIVVFKDASSIFHQAALRRLVDRFRDLTVGCVGGVVKFNVTQRLGSKERAYWVIEELMRAGTETLGYMPSAAGGIHAVRRHLYQPVANDITRDMVDPVQAITAGYRAVRADDAICYEVPWGTTGEVLWNRVRVTKRAWSAIAYNARQLIAKRKWLVLWQLVSHKVCRLSVWLPLLLVLVSSLQLSFSSPIFAILVGAQVFLYATAVAVAVMPHQFSWLPGAGMLTFLLVNALGMALGTLSYLCGKRAVTWRVAAECQSGVSSSDGCNAKFLKNAFQNNLPIQPTGKS
jgi:cellulose synthase/poly-beta-1,6-N-acetylglucosamine synthase-like glycosyltransferase